MANDISPAPERHPRAKGRARLQCYIDPQVKLALAHAATDRSCTLAALVEEALRQHPDVKRRMEEGKT